MSIATNTLLQNRYLVTQQLGRGGMGAVYQATDQRFGSTVAIKQMLVEGEHLKKAFEREAILLNSLRHASLPMVMDHFTEGAGHFLVMQFIPGEDLAEALIKNNGPFQPDRVAQWANQLLAALEYLHTRSPQIVHRDIKPQNIKLTPEGDIVLLDFGLAKGETSGMPTRLAAESVTGYTPVFASLEQMRGQGTDPRSDVYSAAATLYGLFTGHPPVDALARADALLSRQPDPQRLANELNPQVPAAAAQAIHKAMAVTRDDRLQSAKEFRRLIAEAFHGVSGGAPQSAPLPATVVSPPHLLETPTQPQPVARFCMACGARLTEGARFCMKCGKPVTTNPSAAPSRPPSPSIPPSSQPAPFVTGTMHLSPSEIVLLFGDQFAPPAGPTDAPVELLHVPMHVNAVALAQALMSVALLECERSGSIRLVVGYPSGPSGAPPTPVLRVEPTAHSVIWSVNSLEYFIRPLAQTQSATVSDIVSALLRRDSANAWVTAVTLVKEGLASRSLLATEDVRRPGFPPEYRYRLTPQAIALARQSSFEPARRILADTQQQKPNIWQPLLAGVRDAMQRRTRSSQ
jgi:eukaryotic-like serine/threonine-protein kinase